MPIRKSMSIFTEPFLLSLIFLSIFPCSVAEVNQSLVDDGLVDKEKISGTNFFWSFPAKKDRLMQLQHEKVLEQIEALKKAAAEASAALMDAKRGREDEEETNAAKEGEIEEGKNDNDENESFENNATGEQSPNKKQKTMARAAKLERLNEIAKERAKIQAELETLKENDPQAIADLEKELELVKQAAFRWTDNLFNCKDYLVKKRGMDKKEAFKLLGIPASFDCK